MFFRQEAKSEGLTPWPFPGGEYQLFREALSEHLITASTNGNGKLQLGKYPGWQSIAIPAILLVGIDERSSRAGTEVLARFFRYTALSVDKEAFERRNMGDWDGFREWWRRELHQFSDSVGKVLGGTFGSVMDAAAADMGFGKPLQKAIQTPLDFKTPAGSEPMRRATVGLLLRSAGLREIGTQADLDEPVFMGRDDDHTVYCAKDGRNAYYVNLDRLDGASRQQRMQSAIEVLCTFGSRAARQSVYERDASRAR